MDRILAVVLCGGAGTRLYPLTEWRSKPAVPLVGKYKLADIPISNCLNAGIDRIFVLTQFNAAGLNQHIVEAYRRDGFSKGFVSVLSAEQTHLSKEWYRGTADAVRQVKHHLDRHNYSHVLILAGDQIYQMDYRDLFQEHVENKAEISVATTPVTAEEATGFGIMHTDEHNRIIHFREKPSVSELPELVSHVDATMMSLGRNYLASTGMYLFNRETLSQILDEFPDVTDFGKEIIPQSLERHHVYSYSFRGYWSDVGSIRSYHAANMELCKSDSPLNFYDIDKVIHTRHETLPPPRIHGAYLQDVVVSEGSVLENCKIYNSVLGVRSIVGKRTTIKNAVILGATYYPQSIPAAWDARALPAQPGIGDACYLEEVIVDQNASVGHGVVLANHDGVQEGEGANWYIKDGIIVIPENAVIADGTVIGTSTRIDLPNLIRKELTTPAVPVGLPV